MRLLDIFAVIALATEAAAICTTDSCLRAVQDAASSLREEDCKSFVQVNVTPATSTIFSSEVSTTTGTTTRTTTQTLTSSAEPSKRWLARHEVIDVLLGRATSSNGPVTVRATAVPEYASPCASSAAYESACSCLGVSSTTVTAPTPRITQVVRVVETTTVATFRTSTSYVLANSSSLLGNSTFGNSTAPYRNATSSTLSSSSSALSSSSTSLRSSESETSTDKYRLKSPSLAEATSSTEASSVLSSILSTISSTFNINSTSGFSNATHFSSVSNATSTGKFLNSTSSKIQSGVASPTGSHSSASSGFSIPPNATTSAPFANSTQLAPANATSSITKLSNSTLSAPFANITSAPSLQLNSSTIAPFLNTTLAPFLNTTHLPLFNATNATTTIAPFLNTTTTRAPFLNATSSARFANTTTPPTPTPTSAGPCERTTAPFILRVAQPGGMFDGWYVRLSGDAALFNPSAEQASRFSLDAQSGTGSGNGTGAGRGGHLCAAALSSGMAGNASAGAVVAIAEARDGVQGSAVYFVDPELLDQMENEEHGWYGVLECSGAGGGVGNGNGTGSWNGTVAGTGAGIGARAVAGSGLAARAATNGTSGALSCAQGNKEFWVGCGLGLDITSDGDGMAVVDGWNCTGVSLMIEYTSSQ
ncbi:hypothetical protein GGS26DRAFT_567297 [Hypomontagnella submonticulosa]|nr:hypothetical protein GGS26DRAFT_567297 [Hypomontagnella submonticulosa]